MIHKPSPLNLITLLPLCVIIALSSCTSQEAKLKHYKEQAVEKAWQQERELVSLGHSGTREWNETEKEELLETDKVTGYEGRYINNQVKNNVRLATSADNIVFAKVGNLTLSKEALQSASLRSYLLMYEKKKYPLLGGFIAAIVVLIIAFKKKRGIIIFPAIAGAVLGSFRLGILSGWAVMATIGGFTGGLIAGTLAGIFIFLVLMSIGAA